MIDRQERPPDCRWGTASLPIRSAGASLGVDCGPTSRSAGTNPALEEARMGVDKRVPVPQPAASLRQRSRSH